MVKQTLVLIVVFLTFLSALAGGYYVFFIREQEDDSLGNYSNINNEEEQFTPTKQVDDRQSSGLQVQGASTSDSNPNSLPTPKQFKVYEEYSDDQTASYVDIVKGAGATAEEGDNLAVVYKGWLTNGELFDQSRKNEQGQIEPFVLKLGAGKVIAGWEQTLEGMKVGGKRRLIIPYSAGYGEAGQGPIPPKAMLIFDVELAEVQKQDINPPGAILP